MTAQPSADLIERLDALAIASSPFFDNQKSPLLTAHKNRAQPHKGG
jgi:hypothetical protein